MRIYLKASQPELMPVYKTKRASGADLMSRFTVDIPPCKQAKIRTGVFLDLEKMNLHEPARSRAGRTIAELQVRLRSGISYRTGLMPLNGVGTIDIDYADEICVLVFNPTDIPIQILEGERIAQLVLAQSGYIQDLDVDDIERTGGFGHTG